MSDLKISQLPVTNFVEVTNPLPVVISGVTSQITKNDYLVNLHNFTGNTDTFDGSVMRTLYSRTNVITSTLGVDCDLFSGTTNYGSRNFPTTFFTNSSNYNNKVIHFRTTGMWGNSDNTPNIEFEIYFGNDQLLTTTILGNVTSQANNHPLEIQGELSINNGNVIPCISIGWCDNSGNFKRYSLSNPSTPISITSFTGGDFKVILGNSTTNTITSYLGYIQIWN
jgi:hypothetical protein